MPWSDVLSHNVTYEIQSEAIEQQMYPSMVQKCVSYQCPDVTVAYGKRGKGYVFLKKTGIKPHTRKATKKKYRDEEINKIRDSLFVRKMGVKVSHGNWV
jgi:hypothetical protein